MESLLSTAPLMVAAAPDMDLVGCIDHFERNCAAKGVRVPIGQLLRVGDQHVVTAQDIPALRRIMRKCLEFARDPDRPAIADITDDEVAAIQLYTQQTCLYPMLNAALRDHIHPESLQPFLPYLKLLLTGLNKLPLVRTRVYRGIRLDLHEEYNQLQGKAFTWWAFSSTTTNINVMNSDAFLGTDGPRTLFSIDTFGVDIAAFSAYTNEQEVLILPGTLLTVNSSVNAEPDYWEFEASAYHATQAQSSYGSYVVPLPDDTGTRIHQCQNTDLAHPGWEVYENNLTATSNQTLLQSFVSASSSLLQH